MIRALNALFVASFVFVKPMSQNDERLVISQKKYIQIMLFEVTRPTIAPRNINITKKNQGLLSFSSA